MEKEFYNYSNVRGRTEFELVCAHCGADPQDSPLDPTTCGGGDVTGYSGFAQQGGRMVLPMCLACKDKELDPILIGTANQVQKEQEKRREKEEARKKAEQQANARRQQGNARAEKR